MVVSDIHEDIKKIHKFLTVKNVYIDEAEDHQERRKRLEVFLDDTRRRNLSRARLNTIEAISEILKQLSLEEKSFPDSLSQPNLNNVKLVRAPTQVAINLDVPSAMQYAFTFGNIPLASMGTGVVCLAISTILLTAASKSLQSEVWITCCIVVAGGTLLSFVPSRFPCFFHSCFISD